MGVGDVAEGAAGADGGELLVVTDQPNTAAASDDEVDGGVKGKGVGHPGLVNHNQGRRPNRPGPVGQVVLDGGPGEFGEGVGGAADLIAQLGGGGRRRREPDHSAAGFGPGGGEGLHRGGFAGAGGRDRQLQPRPRGGHLADQRGLPGVQGDPVGARLQQRRIDRRWRYCVAVVAPGGVDEPLLSVQDAGRGEQVGPGDGVDRGAVGAPQHRRFGDAVIRSGQRHRQVLEHVADQQIDQPLTLLGLEFDGSHLPLGLGPDMPDLPGGAVFLHRRQDPAGCILDPAGR